MTPRRPTAIFVLATILAWGLAAPPAAAQTEYFYGDVECGLGPDQCSLRGFSIPGGMAQGTVDFDHLSGGVQTRLDSAVKWAQGGDVDGEPSLDGRDLGFLNGAEDATRTLTLPTPCLSAITTPAAGISDPVLKWDRTDSDCAWGEDAGGGGGGLNTAGVDARVDRQTEPIRTRLDVAEEAQSTIRTSSTVASAARIVVTVTDTAYAVPGGTGAVPANDPNTWLLVTVTASGIDDGKGTFTLSSLYDSDLGTVTRDGTPLNASNGLVLDNTGGPSNDNNQYFIGRDTSGDWYFGSDTGDTYSVTIRLVKLNIAAQPPPDASTTAKGVVELATTAEMSAGTADKVPDASKVKAYVDGRPGPANASTTAKGVVELATSAEMSAGTAGVVPDASVVKSYVDARPSGGGVTTFSALTDTPPAFTGEAGKILEVNADADALVYVDKPIDTDTDTFLGLTDTPGTFVADQWLKVNGAGTGVELVDAPIATPDNASIDARIGPAFRVNALVGGTVEKEQEIINVFEGGGWENVAGSDVPNVREEILNGAQYNPTNIKGGTYGLAFSGGPHHAQAYIAIRVPIGYGDRIPLSRIRLYVGDAATHNPDTTYEDVQAIRLDAANVSLITTDTTLGFRYYSVGPIDKPAGEWFRPQVFEPFQLARNRVQGDELLPVDDGANDRQVLGRVNGEPAWVDLPPTVGDSLEEARSVSFPLSSGTSADAFGAFNEYSPAFDLDDTDKQHGILNVVAELFILWPGTVGDVNMAWEESIANATDRDREARVSEEVLLSELRDADDFVAASIGNINGIRAIRRAAYSASTVVGNLNIVLTHRADNQIGSLVWWDGENGSTNPTIRVKLWVTYTPHDTPASGGGSGTSRGRLAARTVTLPVAAIPRGVNIGPVRASVDDAFSYRWTNLAEGYIEVGSTPTSNIHHMVQLTPPTNPPADNVIGLQYRTRVGDTYKQTANVLWGPGILSEESMGADDYSEAVLYFRGGGFGGTPIARILVRYMLTESGYPSIQLFGDGTALPADSTIEVYELLSGSGPKGDKGDPGADGSSPLLKSISLAPPSATENRKTVTADMSAVVLSDWEGLDLVTDATAVGGVTVANDAIVFASSASATVQAGLTFEGNATGGGARMYVHIRGQLTRNSTTTTPGHMTCGGYHKTSVSGGALDQGPETMLVNCTFLHAAAAGDQLNLQWRAYLQSNSQVDVVAGGSGVMVMVQ